MKTLFFCLALSLLVFTTQAQIVGKVTKITANTSTTGTVVLEDTLAGTKEYVSLRRGDYTAKVSGASTTARFAIYNKYTQKLIWSGSLTGVYVLLAGGNPAGQTNDQKVAYLKANTY